MIESSRSRTRVTPRVEQLEARRLLAGNILFNAGVITIRGTADADRVLILDRGHEAAEHIVVVMTGPGRPAQVRSFAAAEVHRVFFFGGAGNDVFVNGTHVRAIALGGAGDDLLIGGDDRDVVFGGAGADHVFGRGGDDRLFGGLDDDVIHGGLGNDDLSGDAGHNHLSGDDGNDVIHGGADDVIHGGNGDDVVEGGGHDGDGGGHHGGGDG